MQSRWSSDDSEKHVEYSKHNEAMLNSIDWCTLGRSRWGWMIGTPGPVTGIRQYSTCWHRSTSVVIVDLQITELKSACWVCQHWSGVGSKETKVLIRARLAWGLLEYDWSPLLIRSYRCRCCGSRSESDLQLGTRSCSFALFLVTFLAYLTNNSHWL